jgi:hypothetical protein
MLPGTRAEKVLGVLSGLSSKVVGRKEGMGGSLVEKAPGTDATRRDLENTERFLTGPNPAAQSTTRLPETLNPADLRLQGLVADQKNPNYRLKSRGILDVVPAATSVNPGPI